MAKYEHLILISICNPIAGPVRNNVAQPQDFMAAVTGLRTDGCCETGASPEELLLLQLKNKTYFMDGIEHHIQLKPFRKAGYS